jgi:hypothetical protein
VGLFEQQGEEGSRTHYRQVIGYVRFEIWVAVLVGYQMPARLANVRSDSAPVEPEILSAYQLSMNEATWLKARKSIQMAENFVKIS